jgi:uncharacterized protein DUF2490
MRRIVVILVFLPGFSVFAQKQVANQFNSWWTYAGNHKISSKFSVHTFYSFRRNEFVKNWQQSLLRLGLNYHLNEKVILTPGYDWVVNFPYGEQPLPRQITAHRIFEQLILKNNVGRTGVINRFKLEQRFIDIGNDNIFLQRFRYKLAVNLPINKKALGDNTFFISATNELFINYGRGTYNHYFDQNRAYIGLGYTIDKVGTMMVPQLLGQG